MDNDKSGALISSLEKRKGYTQRQLAEALHVSDKAVSKWECGLAAPMCRFSAHSPSVLGVNIEKILEGNWNLTVKTEEI